MEGLNLLNQKMEGLNLLNQKMEGLNHLNREMEGLNHLNRKMDVLVKCIKKIGKYMRQRWQIRTSTPELPEVIPTYPKTQQPEPEKPSSETPGEQKEKRRKKKKKEKGEPEVSTSAGTTYSFDLDATLSTGPPSRDALKAQCKEPRGNFPSPNSNEKYISCWDGSVVELTCPENMVYHPEIGYCVGNFGD
ncbi:uncharacterized protein LOC126551303 [Aphis gossypii]|nr:uncharacterized protein LOC126551303 [Aphis gossypii]